MSVVNYTILYYIILYYTILYYTYWLFKHWHDTVVYSVVNTAVFKKIELTGILQLSQKSV